MAQIQIRANKQIMAGTITNNEIANATIALAKLAQGSDIILRDGSVAMTGALNMGGQLISSLATPVNLTDAATKGYVDQEIANLSSGLEYKGSLDLSLQSENDISDGLQGDFYKISTGGTMLGVTYDAGDMIIFNKDVTGVPTAADIDKIDNTEKAETASTTSYANTTSGLAATDVQAAIDEVEGRLDTAESAITTLNSASTVSGSVAYTVKNEAENGTNTSTVTGATIKDAFNTVDGELDTLNADVTTAGSVLKSIKDNAENATSTSTVGTGTIKGDLDQLKTDLTNGLNGLDSAAEISFDGTTSGMVATDVQGAIDELEARVEANEGDIAIINGDASTAGSIAKAQADAQAYADSAIDAAKLALGTNYSVADITARDALADLTVGDIVFVADDGDAKWAIYKVSATGTPATFVKISDEDSLYNSISAAAIKTAYESNANTNAYTDAEQTKVGYISVTQAVDLDAIETSVGQLETDRGTMASLTTTEKGSLVGAINELAGQLGGSTGDLATLTTDAKTTLVAAINEVDSHVDTNTAAIATINGSGPGSLTQAIADAEAYSDAEEAKYVYGEAPTVTDSSTDVTLANTPDFITGVYLNGLRTNFYSLAGSVISFTEALQTGDVVYVDYKTV